MDTTLGEVFLRPIQHTDDLGKLSLGHQSFTPLKIFLKNHAVDFHHHEIAKTYVIVQGLNVRVWGYVTLLASEVVLNDDQRPHESSAISRYQTFPAVKVARLAVDKTLHGNGIGKELLMWALERATTFIMPHIGCRFVIVDSKRSSVSFYKKVGFSLVSASEDLDEYPLMIFDLYKANCSAGILARSSLILESLPP